MEDLCQERGKKICAGKVDLFLGGGICTGRGAAYKLVVILYLFFGGEGVGIFDERVRLGREYFALALPLHTVHYTLLSLQSVCHVFLNLALTI